MLAIYIFSFLILFLIFFTAAKKKKSSITSRFGVLIRQLHKLDKNLVMENLDRNEIILFSSNVKGTISIFLAQYEGIVSIILESGTIENSIVKKEWIFLDNVNQLLIFNQIITDIHSFPKSSFDTPTIERLAHKSNSVIKNIILNNPYSPYNIPQSLFCIAFAEAQQITNFQNISPMGFFEVLFFNCMVLIHRNKPKDQNKLWDQLVVLLVFYLENHNLINHVKDMQRLLQERSSFYSDQMQQIKSDAGHNYNMLYYYFYINPLSLHSKIKLKAMENSSLSKTLHGAGFSKIVLFMMADLQEKFPVLQNLIL